MAVVLELESRPFGFVTVGGWDAEQKAMFPTGARVTATITRGKSKRMFRFYWAMVDMVAQAIGDYKDLLSDELLRRTRRVDSYVLKNGAVKIRVKSLSAMDHDEFKSYLDDAIDLIIRDYLADMTRMTLLRKVERMVGLSYEEALRKPSPSKRIAA